MADNLAFTFFWKIVTLFDFAVLRNFYVGIASKTFIPGSFEKTHWRLQLFPKGIDGSNCFDVVLLARVPESIEVEYQLSFLGPSNCISHVTSKVSATISFPGTRIENCPTLDEVFVTKRSEFLPKNVLTLQLKLWKSAGVVEKAEEYCSFTEINSREYRRNFRVFNFSNFQLEEDKMIPGYIETSSIGRKRDFTDLTMNMHMKGKTTQDAAVDITVTPYIPRSRFPLSCKLSVLDASGKLVFCRQDSESSVSERWTGKWEFTKFFTRQEIIDSKNNLLSIDSLLLACEIVVMDTRDKENCSLLQDDLLSLYLNKTLCDFELRAGDSSFPVHKVILAARSPVFNAMFTSEMRDAASGVSEIPDLDADTLKIMLEYIYTDRVSGLLKDNAPKVYYAADKYLLPKLKQKCVSYMRANVDLSNVCEVLELAHRHRDEDLKSSVHEFIIQNLDKTVRSPEWVEFMAQNVQLAAEAMHELLSKVEIKGKK